MTQVSSSTTTLHVCASAYKFTGKERDTESELDYFGARYYGCSMRQVMSPDPFLNSGRPDNPQTWNRYTYSLSSRLKNVDPSGLYNLDSGCLDDKKCAASAKNFKNGIADLAKAVIGRLWAPVAVWRLAERQRDCGVSGGF